MKKDITMQRRTLSGGKWVDDGAADFTRVSRWIRIDDDPVTERHSLHCYAHDGYLLSFRWRGRRYALDQFFALGNPFFCPFTYSWTDRDGHTCFLSGVDADNYYNPIYIEIDEYGEHVRVYEKGV